MSVGVPVESVSEKSVKTVDKLLNVYTLILPLVTIVGLMVLLAMGRIDPTAGIGLIGALAGAHTTGIVNGVNGNGKR